VTQTHLEILCTGRTINPRSNRPYGRTCGLLFTSTRPYRSATDWIERARVAGWRVSPLQPDHTVNAYCPACTTGKGPKRNSDSDLEGQPMPTDTRQAVLTELRSACATDDQRLDIERVVHTEAIRGRLAAATAGTWYTHTDHAGIIRVLCQTSTSLYVKVASMLRTGRNPKADAALIANAPADLAWLLAETGRLRAERDLLRDRADDETLTAYWTLRAGARQQELASR
jgi:hypothetical protein